MINVLFASWAITPLGLLVILITMGIPIILIVLIVRFLIKANKERQRLRLELGKLADELEQVRKQAQSGEKSSSLTEPR
jgi:uncharacterized membrane-anchored protein YhcB (DUF1043 family)